jgi:polysaccharide biosynthesis transport protein
MNNTPYDDNDSGRGVLLSRHTRSLPAQYLGSPIPTENPSESGDITVLMQYLQLLWKRKWTVMLLALVGVLVGLAVSLGTTPIYYAATSVEFQGVQEQFNLLGGGNSSLGTQIQLLNSQTLLSRVTTKLREKKPAQAPEVKDPLAGIRGLLGLKDPGKSVDWNRAVSVAAGARRINQSKDSSILTISTQSPNPQAAADFANAMASEYIAQGQEKRWDAYATQEDWLARAEKDLKSDVENSQRKLQEFARANGLIITGAGNTAEFRLRELQAAVAKATEDRISKQSIYEASRANPTSGQSLPDVLDSGNMAGYQAKLSDLRVQLALKLTTMTDKHPQVEAIQSQIRSLEATIEREQTSVLQRTGVLYNASKNAQEQLEAEFAKQARILSSQGELMIQYNMLLKEAETSQKLFEQTMAQGKQAGVASAMRSSSARIVDPAGASPFPMKPNLPFNLGLGFMGGLACGTMIVILRSAVDVRIQSPGTLGVLNLRELGVIPSASLFPELKRGPRLLRGAVDIARRKGRSEPGSIVPSEASEPQQESLELVTWTQKSSVMSESFRAIMTSILFSSNGDTPPQVLVLTSPSAQEGKTMVTTNLAIALAEINRRVLLIDADMRLPRIHTVFDQPNTFGLSDFLHERRPVEEYVDEELVRKTHIPNLYTMCAGPARSSLSRLLHSDRMKELLLRLRGTFDTILIDSPPVLNVADARILARSADGVILVVRAHKTHQESAFAAVRCFEQDGCQLLGTILNDWNPKHSSGQYGQYGSYGTYGT